MKHVITGSDLKSLREKLGLTQEYVAQYIGVSRQTLGNWENELGDPPSIKFLKLLRLYGIKTVQMVMEEVENAVSKKTGK